MRDIDETTDGWDEAAEALPAWARALLSRSAVDSAPGSAAAGSGTPRDAGATAVATAAIMERVRREPRPHRSAVGMSPPMRASRWTRRGLLTPFGAAALAGMLGLLLSVRAVTTIGGGRGASAMTLSAAVIGDTVMPSLGDTVRDTLRIVEFVLRGPAARGAVRADVIGDFNAWRRGATAMAQRADGTWYARVVVPRDAVRFAYAVNDEATDTPAAGTPGSGGHAPPLVMRARIDSI